MEQKMRERERALKAKDYARRQREIINQKTESSKKAAIAEPQVHQYQRKEKTTVEVIQEVPEEQNESTPLAVNKKAEVSAVIAERSDKVDAKVQLID